MNDFEFTQYADKLAKDVMTNVVDLVDRSTLSEIAHDYAGWSEYTKDQDKAYEICLHCDVWQGEEFLADCKDSYALYDSMVCTIVHGELVARIEAAIDESLEGRLS